MRLPGVFRRALMLMAVVAVAAGSAGAATGKKAYAVQGGFGLGYGLFRFAGGLSEQAPSIHFNVGVRVYHRLSLGFEFNWWSPSHGSCWELQLVYPFALFRYNVSAPVFLQAGVGIMSLEGNIQKGLKSWSGADTSPAIMLGAGYDLGSGRHISFVPTLQWIHSTVGSAGSRTENGCDYFSFVLSFWFH